MADQKKKKKKNNPKEEQPTRKIWTLKKKNPEEEVEEKPMADLKKKRTQTNPPLETRGLETRVSKPWDASLQKNLTTKLFQK